MLVFIFSYSWSILVIGYWIVDTTGTGQMFSDNLPLKEYLENIYNLLEFNNNQTEPKYQHQYISVTSIDVLFDIKKVFPQSADMQ